MVRITHGVSMSPQASALPDGLAGVSGQSGAHRIVSDPREWLVDPWVIDHVLSVTRKHGDLGRITTTSPTPRLSRTPVHVGPPAPRPGSDAKEILEEVGLGNQFDRLVEEQVVHRGRVKAELKPPDL